MGGSMKRSKMEERLRRRQADYDNMGVSDRKGRKRPGSVKKPR